jgi:CubicO group peptidase (beta-lactamase class C family)
VIIRRRWAGHATPASPPPRELFAAKLESGEDLGASVAVDIDGETVVDPWGGWADEARTVPWGEDAVANVFSVTKTMTSLAATACSRKAGRAAGAVRADRR